MAFCNTRLALVLETIIHSKVLAQLYLVLFLIARDVSGQAPGSQGTIMCLR